VEDAIAGRVVERIWQEWDSLLSTPRITESFQAVDGDKLLAHLARAGERALDRNPGHPIAAIDRCFD
jgi:tRNA nucleotidyltransferase/poly(A) polymerase